MATLCGGAKGALIGSIAGAGLATAGYASTGIHRGDKNLKSAYGGERRLNPNTLDYDWGAENPRESYRNTSSRIANSMNSSGDIVLGMHNMRRG